MILWKDFIIDDSFGPVLKDSRSLDASRSSIKDDARQKALIQETRREAEPLSGTNTGCVRDTAWTKVHAQGLDSNLETNAFSHRDVENGLAQLRPRGAG